MVDEKGLVAITFSANGPRRHLSGQETTSTVTRLGLVPYSRARKRRRQEAGRQDEHYGQDRQKSWMGMKMVSAHPTDCHDQNRSGRRAKNGSGGGRKGRSGGGRKNRVPLILSLSKDERRSNAFWTYLLTCADGWYYVGHTDDLEKRLAAHQDGSFAGYTARRRPVTLTYAESFDSRDDAFHRKRQIKGWSRAKKEALAREDWRELQRLAKAKGAHPSTGSG